eukprot:3121120-Amphidinium_carterae.1
MVHSSASTSICCFILLGLVPPRRPCSFATSLGYSRLSGHQLKLLQAGDLAIEPTYGGGLALPTERWLWVRSLC